MGGGRQLRHLRHNGEMTVVGSTSLIGSTLWSTPVARPAPIMGRSSRQESSIG